MRKTRKALFLTDENNSATRLVVLLHAYTQRPSNLDHVRAAVKQTIPDADIFVPKLPASTFSFADPALLSADLVRRITQLWERKKEGGRPGYEGITLVGHSLGGLLARKTYLVACGVGDASGNQSEAAPWAAQVDRIILLAAMNRGWSISHHMSLTRSFAWTVGTWIGNLLQLVARRPPLIFHIRRGAPFLANLRLQWLALREHAAASKVGASQIIQLLGSIDDMVGPEDNVDLVTGADFIYLDVPFSGHKNIIVMDATMEGKARRERFVAALAGPLDNLKQEQILPEDLPLSAKRKDVTDVIFVIHGIRDLGYWTQKVARRIIALGKGTNQVYESETATYGYFPMLPFLLSSRRRQKVEWLMDQYTEAKALYPNAEFSYVGHSNGTYLLAKALQSYPLCQFKRVVFAGSVVRSDYNWQAEIDKGRVREVLNYVASGDWVVAFFPKALQMINVQDLGSAGHDGFSTLSRKHQVKYVHGGHGAALDERNWEGIASFIVNGEVVEPSPLLVEKRVLWVTVLGSVAPLIWMLIFSGIYFGGYLIVTAGWPEWTRTAVLIGYVMLIWKILTRV